MEYLDLKGMTCPMPVVETKRLLESKDVREIEVVVDNSASSENVKRFLVSKGFTTATIKENDTYHVRGILDRKPNDASNETEKLLVYIDGETMGRGNDELGKILIGAFLKTLKELETPPWRIIFINTGVKLVSQESEYIGILKEIMFSGAEILSCGTCLDFFKLKDKIAVGRISNMFEILSSFTEATKVIRP